MLIHYLDRFSIRQNISLNDHVNIDLYAYFLVTVYLFVKIHSWVQFSLSFDTFSGSNMCSHIGTDMSENLKKKTSFVLDISNRNNFLLLIPCVKCKWSNHRTISDSACWTTETPNSQTKIPELLHGTIDASVHSMTVSQLSIKTINNSVIYLGISRAYSCTIDQSENCKNRRHLNLREAKNNEARFTTWEQTTVMREAKQWTKTMLR